jgi:two-component system, cell cycle sensor histidine kinase and response regulator CckA
MWVVLVIEDDDAVRQILRRALPRDGFMLLQARGGREALALAERYEGTIDAIVADINLPDANGRTVADALLQTRPDTKVVLVGGQGEELEAPSARERGWRYLPKPFAPSQLRDVLRRLVAGTEGG